MAVGKRALSVRLPKGTQLAVDHIDYGGGGDYGFPLAIILFGKNRGSTITKTTHVGPLLLQRIVKCAS